MIEEMNYRLWSSVIRLWRYMVKEEKVFLGSVRMVALSPFPVLVVGASSSPSWSAGLASLRWAVVEGRGKVVTLILPLV